MWFVCVGLCGWVVKNELSMDEREREKGRDIVCVCVCVCVCACVRVCVVQD